MTLEQSQRALRALTDQLNADETELLTRVARKIVNGKVKHGALDLDSDTRHWPAEMQDERIDAALYGYMEQIQNERRAKRETSRTATCLAELVANAPGISGVVEVDLSEGGES